MPYPKTIWVVDDFYQNPEEIRNLALSVTYEGGSKWYKGHRSITVHRPDSIKQLFENIMGRTITKWDYGMNGRFQYTTAEDQIVYHNDQQMYGALVYLNPDAPYRCGTTLLASDKENPFEGGYFDKTKFDVVDTIGNVYNRLVIFEGKNIHAASEYFGTGLEDSRLIHLFFFDTE